MADNSQDTLTRQIGVLLRRETEARVLAPLIAALGERFGRDEVIAVVSEVIARIARDEGAALAAEYGNGPDAFFETLEFWTRGGALEIEVLEKSDTTLDFNVTRCRYAEMYHALGMSELGEVFSCNRDRALIEGFNGKANLSRAQTILGGDECCTFRYDFGEKQGKAGD